MAKKDKEKKNLAQVKDNKTADAAVKTDVTSKAEKPKEEVKEVKETPKEAPKDTKKTSKEATTEQPKAPKEKKTKEVVVVAEEADLAPKQYKNVPLGSQSSSFDGKAQLAFVMQQRYANNKELAEHYPEFCAAMSRNIDVVVVLALVDLQNELNSRNESGEIKLNVSADQVIQLNEAAGLLGIELATPKALPDSKQLQINFSESNVPEALKEEKPAEETVELDPKKISTDEEINKALSHLMMPRNNNRNIAENIVNTVEWYRTFCGLKEENADKKLALDERTVGEWLKEIFNRIPTSTIFNGFGGAMYNYTVTTGSPIKAHCITHGNVAKVGWSEEQIADLVKAFVTGKYQLKVKNQETTDKPEENKALQAIVGSLGIDYVDKIFQDANSEDESIRKEARSTIAIVKNNYFEKGSTPSENELRMKIGQIINLYRDPMNRIEELAFAQAQVDAEEKKK